MSKTEKIYPLNIQGGYSHIFYGQTHNHVLVQMTPYAIEPNMPRTTRHFAKKLKGSLGTFQLIAKQIAQHPVLTIPGVELTVLGDVDEMPYELAELVTAPMVECSIDGIYPSVSFMEIGGGTTWSTEVWATRLGMICMQNWLTRTTSSDPNNHRELLVTPACAEVYREEIGNVFESANGAWTIDLEGLLCPYQVALRAWMLGNDPIQALDALRELPAANLLDYLHTMPERLDRYEFVRPKGRKVKK